MQKKKFNLLLFLGMLPFVAYAALVWAGIWYPGITIWETVPALQEFSRHPLVISWNEVVSMRWLLIFFLLYTVIMLLYFTSKRNYMFGREHGTSHWQDIKAYNKKMVNTKKEYQNRILSQNVKLSINTRQTDINNNILVVGGSGAGKTFFLCKPNLLQGNTSFVVTDPKGEMARDESPAMKALGYNVKILNLLEMDKSDHYNPFLYIEKQTDVIRLISNLISNTTPKGSSPQDPFWEKAEGMFLQALFYYVWYEEPIETRNVRRVMELLSDAEVIEDEPSKLDIIFDELEEKSPRHPAVLAYNKSMRGAADTVRSVVMSANARLAYLENEDILRILDYDDIHMEELGIGANGNGKTKTVLFCVIPDVDKSYNFIVGLLYTQLFQRLYYEADFHYGGQLPIHVTFLLDEFANVALPDDYTSLLSTMRSREISSIIIIQNMAQLKELFKDGWEKVPGCCDTFIYLGGYEQSTHEYVSKLLGKATIDKRTTGETRGRQGSASRNYDNMGRELMTPDEVAHMGNKECLVFVKGYYPIRDKKYRTFKHPRFVLSADGEAEKYVHQPKNYKIEIGEENVMDGAIQMLDADSLEYYKRLKDEGKHIYFIDFGSAEELLKMTKEELLMLSIAKESEDMQIDEQELFGAPESLEAYAEEADTGKESADMAPDAGGVRSVYDGQPWKPLEEDNIFSRLICWDEYFSDEQVDEVDIARREGVPPEVILTYLYPSTPLERMVQEREEYVRQHVKQENM